MRIGPPVYIIGSENTTLRICPQFNKGKNNNLHGSGCIFSFLFKI
jgi:hypothetical protein